MTCLPVPGGTARWSGAPADPSKKPAVDHTGEKGQDHAHEVASMTLTYSLQDAKAKLSEVIRKVRSGDQVVITYHGKRVARVVPMEDESEETFEERIARLEREGEIIPADEEGPFDLPREPIARIPGALKRFLDER
jgi:prevent-host-death family protein